LVWTRRLRPDSPKTLHRESPWYPQPIWWCSNSRDALSVPACGTCFFVTVTAKRFRTTAVHVVAEAPLDRNRVQDTH
jgi:hypothetical protein